MADVRRTAPGPAAGGEAPYPDPPPGEDADRRPGTIEGLLQEVIRRAATIGLGGFFLTEEAIRKAFSDVVPQDWVQFVGRQSQETRGELIDRMAREFGTWLREVDPRSVVRTLFESFSFSIRIEISAHPRDEARTQHEPDPDPGRGGSRSAKAKHGSEALR